MNTRAPIIFRTRIKPEWLDYNNHMNVAYYVLIFDLAGVELVSQLGLSEAVTEKTGISWMVLENHITYNNEVVLDQPVEIRCQLIDHDNKRLHLYFEMYAYTEQGVEYLASTLEQMAMCVDLNSRSSCEFPPEVDEQINAMAKLQSELTTPANIGRKIGIRRR
ncbi:thioesterase family protein [uncultured Amphritea sp.]|uniref:thioesterase family protein n=1 Tax=uncultured Amphritea sp. TaxID=981605 RepID=UPI0025F67C5B|nr:thioesterase family protein [uncultured Amphritea sp.]